MRNWFAPFLFSLLAAFNAAQPSPAQAKEDRAVIVVASPVMETALAPWKKYRESQGYKIEIVRPAEDFEHTRYVIHDAVKRTDAKFIVLVGDVHSTPAQRAAFPDHATIPACNHVAKVNILFGGEGPIATDNAYADLDGDKIPELAIGRIPVDTPQELTAYIKRLIAYETNPNSSLWRRKIHLVAGVGNFGPVIDSVLESATKKFLMDGIPNEYETSITQASWRSPYCPDPRRFSDVTMERITDGGLFWVYLGHGHEKGLDRLWISRRQHFPIMESVDAKKLTLSQGPPIAVLLACHTGAYDLPQDCFAEDLLRAPGGPIAVISGSRVTMPYGNSIFGDGLLEGYFQRRLVTLGEVFLHAKTQLASANPDSKNRKLFDQLAQLVSPKPELLGEERIEHVQLYQLLGDPLLALPRPTEIGIVAPETCFIGDELNIEFQSNIGGRAVVEIVCPRDQNKFGVSNRFDLPTLEAEWSDFQETYAKANDVCWLTTNADAKIGKFTTKLKLPADCEGLCYIRIHATNGKDFALGAKELRVERAKSTPLQNAHAHNDYLHKRPLFDALDQGFTSVEADIFLVEGKLLVAHTSLELNKEKTLEGLYLKPLAERIAKNGGRVYPKGPTLTLLIDIKTKGPETYAALDKLLAGYSEILSQSHDGKFEERAITVIISGNRPIDEIKASKPRHTGIDGRLSDLDSVAPADLMPLISDNWTNHFKYRGQGEMSDEEKKKLAEMVAKVHAKGRRLRFWATPESPALWKELKAAGVDLIGTDELEKLATFLRDEK